MTADRPTILVVDDDPGLIELYDAWLAADHTVRTASDGREALDALTGDVEVVVLDREMPKMTGDQFLRRCRQQGWDCRVLVVTGTPPEGDAVDLGFDAYLTKPIERQPFLEHVSMLLRRQQYSETAKAYFATVSKLAVLDEDALDTENGASYEQLVERRRQLRADMDGALDEFGQRDFEAEFQLVDSLPMAD